MTTLDKESIIVGVDVHKYSHTAVAMDSWGQEKGVFEFSNDKIASYTAWLSSFGEKRNIVIGLEDVNSYGVHIVEALRGEGFNLRYVPSILTERERKSSTKQHKSDYVDAKRVGKVILSKYEQTLPAKESIADEEELRIAQKLDLLLMERRDLVKEKTILKNQIHALLHQYYGDRYATLFKKTFSQDAIDFWLEDSLIQNKEILGISVKRRINRLVLIENQILDISTEVTEIGKSSKEVLALYTQIHGCGMVTAASIMAELTTIKRFKSKHNLASYAGIAPIEHSSGQRNRLHTNPFGNRRLNRAIHTIALSQIACKGDDRGKEYYQRKLKEGKTKLWSLRCLKHQIVKRVFQVLKEAR